MKSSLQYRALLDICFVLLIFIVSFSIAHKVISIKVKNAQMFWSTSQFFESVTLMNFAFGMVPGDFEYKAELSYEIPEIRFFTTNSSSPEDLKAHYIIAGFYEEEAFNLLGFFKDLAITITLGRLGLSVLMMFGFYYPKDLLYVVKDVVEFFEGLGEAIAGFFGKCGCNSTISAVFFQGFCYDDNSREITGDNPHQYYYPLIVPFFTYPSVTGNIYLAFECEGESANTSAIESIGNNIYKLKEDCLCKSACDHVILFVQRDVNKIWVYRKQHDIINFRIYSRFLS